MTIEEIKERLYEVYEIEEEYNDEEKGCYINGRWLSIENIIKALEGYEVIY